MAHTPAGPVPVVVMGLGFIGQQIARAALASPELKLVGVVDASPQLLGRKLSEVLGVPGSQLKIVDSIGAAVGRAKKGVLLHATGSRLPQVMEQLLEAIGAQLSVVSTCEELSFPYL